ncbi:hypothetical protein C8J56DRAFT_930735 [Mycena floridula]|nr:hypothetical protein C8J56DRAFT_930735 [Mycena floridula]
MSSSSETTPLLATRISPPTSKAAAFWLIPVVFLASINYGIQTGSRNSFYTTVCSNRPQLPRNYLDDCTLYPFLENGIVRLQLVSLLIGTITSALTTGCFGRFSDLHGRKPVMLLTMLGSLIQNVILVLVSSNSGSHPSQFVIWLSVFVEGLFGGMITFTAVAHAYTFDVSSAASRLALFSLLQGFSLLCLFFGGFVGQITFLRVQGLTVPSLIGGAVCITNMLVIGFFLPESVQQIAPRRDARSYDILKAVVSPVSMLIPSLGHTQLHVALLGLALFTYSCATFDGYGMVYVLAYVSGSFKLVFVLLSIKVALYLIIIPGLAWAVKQRWLGIESLPSVIVFDKTVAKYAALTGACSFITIFLPATPAIILFLVLPGLALIALPALYSLGCSYLEEIGDASSVGSLFAAMGVVSLLATKFTFIFVVVILGASLESKSWGLILLPAGGFLATSLLLWSPYKVTTSSTSEEANSNIDV